MCTDQAKLIVDLVRKSKKMIAYTRIAGMV